MEKQVTIQKPVSLKGKGLHTGKPVTMTFRPAPDNHGYKFKRVDLEGQPIVTADANNVVDTSRGTTLSENGAMVYTVEHTLAAVVGMGIDNIWIELDGPEPPIMDGSAKDFTLSLQQAGIVEQEAERKYFAITESIQYDEPDRGVKIEIVPNEVFSAEVAIDFDSGTLPPQEAQLQVIDDFIPNFANCRTFCFLHEVEAMYKAGLIQGGDLDSAVVIVDRQIGAEEEANLRGIFGVSSIKIEKGILNNTLHYSNEPARHKLLDVIGDLALVGVRIKGKVLAQRPGHKANVELAKKIKQHIDLN